VQKNHWLTKRFFFAIRTSLGHNGSEMKGVRVNEMRMTLLLLIESQQYERISSVLDLSISNLNTIDDWNVVLELLHLIPEQIRMNVIPLGLHHARALSRTNCSKELFDFCDTMLELHGIAHVSELEVERSMELYVLRQYQESLVCLELAMEHLQGQALGFAYSKLGLVLYALEKPWLEAFQKARLDLTGLELGKSLLNEGFCFAECHQTAQALDVWQEALVHLRGYPRLLAWVRYNLGITALRDMNLDAERHFLEGLKLTQNPQAAGLRCLMLTGLGAIRRSLGEWDRAEFAYKETVKLARDSYEHKHAHFGLIRTLQLSGRFSESLEVLEIALHNPTLEHHLFYVARALTLLSLSQTKRAKEALEKVGTLVSESDRWLEKIARAELARQEDQFDTAIGYLEGLPIHTLHAREEVRQFPQLFLLLEGAEKEVPQPLEYIAKTIVNVTAKGMLRVTVNTRAVQISPTGRVGELLVFLLEQGGSASLEVIADALYPEIGENKEKARKNVWTLVQTLRNALGWKDSVISLRGAYQLDPKASWEYDIDEARETRKFRGEFLAGVYSNWALEVGRELSELHGERRKNLELN
jgi:tetratricopeptide (TPR) repeat protein